MEEEDFPRGGASALSPLEVRNIKEEAEKDVLFGRATLETTPKKKKKKAKGKTASNKKERLSEAVFEAASKLKHVETLTFKKLVVGMKVLGAVKEVNELVVTMSLPNGLTGFVHITNINEKITEQLRGEVDQHAEEEEGKEEGKEEKEINFPSLQNFFKIGSLVPCTILELQSTQQRHKKITLSLDPQQVNSGLSRHSVQQGMVLLGFVTSVEDHGYLISFGISGTKGFLSKKSVTQGELMIGQPLQLMVKSVSEDARIVKVTTSEEEIANAVVTENSKLKFSSLLPGMLVKATVKKFTPRGMLLTFLDGFEGSVDLSHLRDYGGNGEDLEKTHPKKLSGRLVFINASTKSAGLSLHGDIVQNNAYTFNDCTMGDVIDEGTVLRVDQGQGLLMKLPNGETGYVHISRVSDEHLEKLGKKYKERTKHRCRIVGFNSLDGLVTLTMEKSVIEQPFLRYHDIKPGSVVKGTVITVEGFGMLVSVSDHIRGLCSKLHLADVPLKNPEKKLKEGKVIKCRVLSVEPERRRMLLTHKKSLVNSDGPLITAFEDAKPGMSTHGFITAVKDFGCLVTFYNNVKGLIPRVELGISSKEDPRSMYYVGQVVLCYVLTCQPEEGKLRLSLKASSASSDPVLRESLRPGMLTDVDIVGSSAGGLDVLLQPSGTAAFLPLFHLSDFPGHWQPLLAMTGPTAGEPRRLTGVLYYGQNKDKSHVVSLKPSLLKAVSQGSLLSSFSDLEVGMTLPGFVKQIMSYGVFVEFAPHIFGLAPNSFLADEFLSEPSNHFKVGQSIIAKVREIDTERHRFLVSLRLSDCCPDAGPQGDTSSTVDLLGDFFKEKQRILNHLTQTSEEIASLTAVPPGSCVEAKVISVKHQGIHLQLTDGVQGFTSHQLAKGASCQPGQVVFGSVLDVDVERQRVIVTLEPSVVEERKNALSSKGKLKKLKCGNALDAIVQLVKEEYIIVLLPQHQYRRALAPAKVCLNDVRDASKRFAVGQKYSAVVHSSSLLPDEELPVVILQEKQKLDKENLAPGAITTAQVRTVKDMQLSVSLCGGKCYGRVHVTQISDDVTEDECLLKTFHKGDKVQVKVLGFRDGKTHKFLPISHRNFTKAVAELTMKPSDLASSGVELTGAVQNGEAAESDDTAREIGRKLVDYKAGEEVNGFVKSVLDQCVWMAVTPSVSGRVTLLHASPELTVLNDLPSHFKVGAAYKCTVLGVESGHNVLDLAITGKPDSSLEPGQLVNGRVTKVVSGSGLFIQLPLQRCGMASMTDLEDDHTENPLEKFKVRQLVRCCVLAKKDDHHYDLSLRPSRTEAICTSNDKVEGSKPKDREIKSLSELDDGHVVRGYIKSVSDVGVFVSLARHIVARVQIKNLSQYFVKTWKPLFTQGKLVTGKVLSIDPTKGYIELSLKGKDVGGPDPAPKPKHFKEKEKEKQSRKRKKNKKDEAENEKAADDQDSDAEDIVKKLKFGSSGEEESAEDSPASSSDEEEEKEEEVRSDAQARLELSAGFDWSNDAQDTSVRSKKRELESEEEESSDSEPDTSTQTARKKTKRQKRATKKAEQEFLYKTEQALLDQDRAPGTAEEFDRLVLASPNNSLVWLQYMAFHLHTTEIDKARAVAERALKTISFREEQEKFNIFVALMNLENLYGTQESLVKVFENAMQQNEPKKVFFHLINIYNKSKKTELAEQLYQTMTKRFGQSKKVWVNFGTFFMMNGKVEAARKVLQRSLKSIPKRKHIETIVKFAILEFKYAEPQRGVTVFESVLSNYPKRIDLWSIYIDMMIKQKEPEPVRQIFERITHINLSSKKMKFIFKRYLDFERKFGDDLSVENVKTKAMEFVESKVALN